MNTIPDNKNSTTSVLNSIQFKDIFILDEIQRLQDLFSDASGVASIITHPDGTPITNFSNSCRLCNNIIRKTEKGLANCYHSDAIIGRHNTSGPIVQPCLSGGLWDAGASITIGGKHIANWLIGQVRNEELDEQRMIQYADEIGANREDFMEALNEVPVMSVEKFGKISKMLFAFANELSEKAYNNLQMKMQIAESKQAGETILNKQLLLRTVIDNIPDSIYCKDLNCCKTLANLTELRYMGVKSEAEILGKDDFDFYPKELAEKFFADDQSVINTGKPVINREEYILDEKEQKRWLLSSKIPLRDKDGQIIGLVGIGKDVTFRKLTDEKLKESEKKYRDIFENTLEGIFQTRINGSYISVNPALAKMYGYESPEELMKNRTDVSKDAYYDPKERDNFLRMIEKQGFIKNYEYEVKHKDGHKIWFDEDARAVKDKDGKIQYFEGFVIDITERKQAEAEIKLKNEELLKSNAEKDKFFSIIAHDLRSPFSSFLGLTQIMSEELPNLTMDEIKEIALTMRSSATNLFNLLENLLQWARVEQGLIPFNPKIVQLRAMVSESIAMVLEPAKNKGIDLTCDIPDNIEVIADSNMFQTIIRNLISNAMKFTPKGGKICLSAKASSDKSVEISIKDSGIGMSRALVDNLFRTDVQTSRKGTEGEPSSGLGLMLCKEFIEKHGGKIWAESEEGKGSIFYFTLTIGNR